MIIEQYLELLALFTFFVCVCVLVVATSIVLAIHFAQWLYRRLQHRPPPRPAPLLGRRVHSSATACTRPPPRPQPQ